MAETPKDDRFYKPSTLLRAFGISSIVMMVFTLWMILDDFGREWKGFQREFFQLRTKKYTAAIEEAKKNLDQNKLKGLQITLEGSLQQLASKKKEIEKYETELRLLKTREKIAVVKYQDTKAEWDVQRYHYEVRFGHAKASGHGGKPSPVATSAFEDLQKSSGDVVKLRDKANTLTQTITEQENKIEGIFSEKTRVEKQIKIVRTEVDKLKTAKENADLTLSKLLRSGPIIDMANPVFRIEQTVLPEIRDDIYFAQIQTVDRCASCHVAIDSPGFESEPNPFRTHPRLDLILGSGSPHPKDKIGCTVCHGGRGQAVDFVRAAHVPGGKDQEKLWRKKHGWNEKGIHHIQEKMVPLPFVEGKCVGCHKQTEHVPKAEKLNAAIQLVKAAGCYGCHRIEGFDHLRKPGPSLQNIKGKVTRDWFVRWIRDPKSFNEHTRMPRFFHLSNIEKPREKEYQDAEIFALTDFILAQSQTYTPNIRLSLGNVQRGKELFGSVGCLGCHQIDDFERKRGRFDRAPELSSTGSKVTAYWLLSWLKNPKHYFPDTTMPSLRLTDSEARDLAAYLLQKRRPEFERLFVGSPNPETQKAVLKLYLMRDPKLAPITNEKVDKVIGAMDSHTVSMELGKNSLLRYGCFGCHEIKGFEKTPGIGTELTEEGSKPVNRLDFGLMHLEHTNVHWFDNKLENPRIFDTGTVKEYLDLLRMPDFGFTKPERDRLILFLLGRTSQKITPPAAKILNAREALVEEGLRVVHKYNCQGCHVVERMFAPFPEDHSRFEEHEKDRHLLEGRILAYYSEDETLGPPTLYGEGERVLTDWVHGFMQKPSVLRPRLRVRMPTFQLPNDEINKLVTFFASDGPGVKVEFPFVPEQRVSLSRTQLLNAKHLFNRLQCANCHTVGEKLSPAQMEEGSKGLAPDFLLSAQRLRRDWIVKFLKDPQKLMPGTRMPDFWPELVSPVPDILGGNSQAQIQLIVDYLIYLGQRMPSQGAE